MSKKLILLIGAPGSGKTTDGALVAKNHAKEITSYSTGVLLKQESQSGSAVGKIEENFLSHGDLVPTAIILDVVMDAIKKAPTDIVLIDGFPRKAKQMQLFGDILFNHKEIELLSVIEVKVSEATAKERFLATGESEEVFEHSMRAYQETIEEIERFYQEQDILKVIDGEQSLDAVVSQIDSFLASKL